jgi:hypothetical protein
MLGKREGRDIHGAGNWNMLMERMQNVVVCRDDRQCPSEVTCLLAQWVSHNKLVGEDQVKYISLFGFLKPVEMLVCESVK